MEKRVCVLLFSILCFHLISWTIGRTRIFYQMPEKPFSLSHFAAWKSPHKSLLGINPVLGVRHFNPREDLEYEDDSENDSEEDDEEDEAIMKKKKSKFEKIDDFKLKVASKYLDKFLQIKTKVPPDLPEEAILQVWGPVPDIGQE